MLRKLCCAGVLAAMALSLDAGAVSNQVETMLYDTHQKVTNLSKSLDGAVKKLNDTTTQLLERVNESETQTRELRGMVEESQVKLDSLEQQLGQLTATIYQQFNLTTSGAGYTPAAPATTDSGTTVMIEPPAAPDSVTSTPAPAGSDTVSGGETVVGESTAPASADADSSSAAATSAYQDAQKAWLEENYSGALSQFSDFLVRYPGSKLAGNAQYWQGRCYLKLEQYEEAVTALEKMRVNYPDNEGKVSMAMQSQAVALSRLGRNEEAARLLEEVVKRYPGTFVAQQAQSDLEKRRGN